MRPSILIINDDPNIHWLAKEFFGDTYKLISSLDGVEGLSSIRMNKPDLVLLNLQMPRADGVWVLNQIHKLRLNVNVKFVLMTMYDFEYAQKLTSEFEFDGYIIAPFDKQKLRDEISRVIGPRSF